MTCTFKHISVPPSWHSSVGRAFVCGTIDPGLEPQQSVEDFGSTAMLATKRSAGVTPEVKLREHVTHTPPTIVKKGRADINRSPKQGHQYPKKDLCPPNFFLKNPHFKSHWYQRDVQILPVKIQYVPFVPFPFP